MHLPKLHLLRTIIKPLIRTPGDPLRYIIGTILQQSLFTKKSGLQAHTIASPGKHQKKAKNGCKFHLKVLLN